VSCLFSRKKKEKKTFNNFLKLNNYLTSFSLQKNDCDFYAEKLYFDSHFLFSDVIYCGPLIFFKKKIVIH